MRGYYKRQLKFYNINIEDFTLRTLKYIIELIDGEIKERKQETGYLNPKRKHNLI